tara:strand:+ start:704 stop:1753 length:1050 start_codon:yes stop_codon:yes gene_type:complete
MDFQKDSYGYELRLKAIEKFDLISNLEQLEEFKTELLGRKGSITDLIKNISTLPSDAKKDAGKNANLIKIYFQELIQKKYDEYVSNDDEESHKSLDFSLPGRRKSRGSFHPTTSVVREISKVFTEMGFDLAEGPEVELDEYNFQKLNIPIDHPARDMWNTLWVDITNHTNLKPLLLRTHTSPMQIRLMETHNPPIRVIVPGKTYRYEATDATHEWQFCQVEGLVVDKGITFAHLKSTLEEFAQKMFGQKRKARFRCDFFPFVEPGAEVSIDCFKCEGAGCKVCGFSGWIEIMGAGMVHPEVLKGVGYDPETYSGFAFGMGAERISMLRNGIDDVRLFYSNDLRFLKQFS